MSALPPTSNTVIVPYVKGLNVTVVLGGILSTQGVLFNVQYHSVTIAPVGNPTNIVPSCHFLYSVVYTQLFSTSLT